LYYDCYFILFYFIILLFLLFLLLLTIITIIQDHTPTFTRLVSSLPQPKQPKHPKPSLSQPRNCCIVMSSLTHHLRIGVRTHSPTEYILYVHRYSSIYHPSLFHRVTAPSSAFRRLPSLPFSPIISRRTSCILRVLAT